jgi:hypothetical protein
MQAEALIADKAFDPDKRVRESLAAARNPAPLCDNQHCLSDEIGAIAPEKSYLYGSGLQLVRHGGWLVGVHIHLDNRGSWHV